MRQGLRLLITTLAASWTISVSLASTLIPTDNLETKIVRLLYKGISSNSYSVENSKLRIAVNNSSSPVVIPFKSPQKLRSLKVIGELLEVPKFADVDDFILRIGPAFSGNKKLGPIETLLAPAWIVEMNKVAEKHEVGFGGLDLSLISAAPGPAWKERLHPKSKLIHETIALVLSNPGKFEFTKKYSDSESKSLGIWIGADGDDSHASFNVMIESLEIEFFEDVK